MYPHVIVKRDKNWISAETRSLINKRREIKEKKATPRSQRLIEKLSAEYSLANREVRKSLQKNKRMQYENLASQAGRAAIRGRGEKSELYRATRDLSGKFQGECDAVKDKNTLIYSRFTSTCFLGGRYSFATLTHYLQMTCFSLSQPGVVSIRQGA